MRNLTYSEWATAMIVALLIGWLGSVFNLTELNIVAVVVLAALAVERFVNQYRARSGGRP